MWCLRASSRQISAGSFRGADLGWLSALVYNWRWSPQLQQGLRLAGLFGIDVAFGIDLVAARRAQLTPKARVGHANGLKLANAPAQPLYPRGGGGARLYVLHRAISRAPRLHRHLYVLHIGFCCCLNRSVSVRASCCCGHINAINRIDGMHDNARNQRFRGSSRNRLRQF